MENAAKQKGYDFAVVGLGILQNIGLYSLKHKSFDAIPVGGTVAIANDPVNQGRGLLLLQKAGLIKLKDGVGFLGTLDDITENPKKLKFTEVEGPQLVRITGDVDLAQGYPHFIVASGSLRSDQRPDLFRHRGQAVRRELRHQGGRARTTRPSPKFVDDLPELGRREAADPQVLRRQRQAVLCWHGRTRWLAWPSTACAVRAFGRGRTGSRRDADPAARDRDGRASRRPATVRFESGLARPTRSAAGEVSALDGVDLDIPAGAIFGIIGRSGAGKSSLIRTVNRLEEPTSGRVLVDGDADRGPRARTGWSPCAAASA